MLKVKSRPPCSTLILTAPKFSPALLVYAPILQPPSSFIEQSITCNAKQQGLTEHNLLDLTFGTEQQKQNSTKLGQWPIVQFAFNMRLRTV